MPSLSPQVYLHINGYKTTGILHYKQHEKYPDFNVKKLCKLVLLNGEKMQIFPTINLCIENFCFCTCEFLWVKPDGVLMKKSWLLFLLSILVVLMFIFIKKSPKSFGNNN